jgi:hypothetical protein
MSSRIEAMTNDTHIPDLTSQPLLIQIDSSATDGFYRQLGSSAFLKDDERSALGSFVVVCDREGRCSLHRVTGIHRPSGVRTVRFGPQVEWPSGGTALRQIDDYRS